MKISFPSGYFRALGLAYLRCLLHYRNRSCILHPSFAVHRHVIPASALRRSPVYPSAMSNEPRLSISGFCFSLFTLRVASPAFGVFPRYSNDVLSRSHRSSHIESIVTLSHRSIPPFGFADFAAKRKRNPSRGPIDATFLHPCERTLVISRAIKREGRIERRDSKFRVCC